MAGNLKHSEDNSQEAPGNVNPGDGSLKVSGLSPKSPAIDSVNSNENTTGPSVSFEEILEDLGCFGRYQLFTLVAYLTMEIATAFVVFIPIFVGRTVIPGNCTEQNPAENHTDTDILKYSVVDGSVGTIILNHTTDSSSWTSSLSFRSLSDDIHHVLESPFKYESVVEEWDLKCDRAWIPDIFTSCLMGGMIIGNLVASPMSDWYGRRKAYLANVIGMFIGTLMTAISPNPYVYAITRLLTGAGFCGCINVSTMAVMEFMTPKWRSLANCAGPMGEGVIILSIVAYFIDSWRMLYLATLTPYILIIPIYMYLPESPRWLLRNNKVLEAHTILSSMAHMNKRKPVSMEVLEALRRQEQLATSALQSQKIGYAQFLRTRELVIKSLYLFAIWFSWNVGYYGISYNIRNVPGNRFFNVALIGVANAFGQRSSMPASDRLGRRRAVLFGMGLSAVFLVALAITFIVMKEVNTAWILCACTIGLFGLACTRGSARLLSGETFPTSVRVMGLGIGSLGANLAGLITPQVAYLGSIFPSLPFFIFAGISVLGSLVVFLMKETTGNPLSDEVELCNNKTKEKA